MWCNRCSSMTITEEQDRIVVADETRTRNRGQLRTLSTAPIGRCGAASSSPLSPACWWASFTSIYWRKCLRRRVRSSCDSVTNTVSVSRCSPFQWKPMGQLTSQHLRANSVDPRSLPSLQVLREFEDRGSQEKLQPLAAEQPDHKNNG